MLLLCAKPLMAQQVQLVEPTQAPSEVRRSWLSVRTNALADIALVPNMGLEAFIGERWSWELSGYGAWWSKPKANFFWRLKGLESEVKYWLGQREQGGKGHHIGLYTQFFDYDFQMGGRGVLGDRTHFGLGVAYGYAWSLSKQWTPRRNHRHRLSAWYFQAVWKADKWLLSVGGNEAAGLRRPY